MRRLRADPTPAVAESAYARLYGSAYHEDAAAAHLIDPFRDQPKN